MKRANALEGLMSKDILKDNQNTIEKSKNTQTYRFNSPKRTTRKN